MSFYLPTETLAVWPTFPDTAVVCGVPETSLVSEVMEAVVVTTDQGPGTLPVRLTVTSSLPAQPRTQVRLAGSNTYRWISYAGNCQDSFFYSILICASAFLFHIQPQCSIYCNILLQIYTDNSISSIKAIVSNSVSKTVYDDDDDLTFPWNSSVVLQRR